MIQDVYLELFNSTVCFFGLKFSLMTIKIEDGFWILVLLRCAKNFHISLFVYFLFFYEPFAVLLKSFSSAFTNPLLWSFGKPDKKRVIHVISWYILQTIALYLYHRSDCYHQLNDDKILITEIIGIP